MRAVHQTPDDLGRFHQQKFSADGEIWVMMGILHNMWILPKRLSYGVVCRLLCWEDMKTPTRSFTVMKRWEQRTDLLLHFYFYCIFSCFLVIYIYIYIYIFFFFFFFYLSCKCFDNTNVLLNLTETELRAQVCTFVTWHIKKKKKKKIIKNIYFSHFIYQYEFPIIFYHTKSV